MKTVHRMSLAVGWVAMASIAACSPTEESGPLQPEGGTEAGAENVQPGGDAATASPVPDAGQMDVVSDRAAASDWWNPMFSRRRRVETDARLAPPDGGTLADFPVALSIAAETLDAAVVGADGADVRFVDAMGNVLSRDLEAWDPHGASIVWLRLPSLPPLAATTPIYMYYGATGATPVAGAPEAVWAAPYAAVWHFAGKANDATANHFDGALTKATFEMGKLGQAAKFDATAQDHIGLAHGSSLLRSAEAVTVSAWIKTGAIDKASYGVILGVGTADTTGHLSRTSMMVWGSLATYPYGGQLMHDALYGEINPDEASGGWEFAASPVETIHAAQWQYVTAVFDARGKSTTLYSDGKMVAGPLVIPGQGGGAAAAGKWTAAAFPASPSDRVEIGAEEDVTHGYYDGLIDELRVETVARSPQWIAAQAMAVTGEAITLGPEERAP